MATYSDKELRQWFPYLNESRSSDTRNRGSEDLIKCMVLDSKIGCSYNLEQTKLIFIFLQLEKSLWQIVITSLNGILQILQYVNIYGK